MEGKESGAVNSDNSSGEITRNIVSIFIKTNSTVSSFPLLRVAIPELLSVVLSTEYASIYHIPEMDWTLEA